MQSIHGRRETALCSVADRKSQYVPTKWVKAGKVGGAVQVWLQEGDVGLE